MPIEHIIIVDNASGNCSLEKIINFLKNADQEYELVETLNPRTKKRVLLHQNHTNSGYAQGNNIGIQIAQNCNSSHILILNNDVKVFPDTISNMASFISNNSYAACIGPVVREGNSFDYNFARKRLKWFDHFLLSGIMKKLLPFKKIRKHHFIAYKEFPKSPFKVDMISGSFMLFSADVLEKIGGFDPNTFLFYEEAIICEKLRNLGLETYIVPSSIVLHEHAGTIRQVHSTKILKYSLDSQFYYLNDIRKYPALVSHLLMFGQYLTFLIVLLTNQIRKK